MFSFRSLDVMLRLSLEALGLVKRERPGSVELQRIAPDQPAICFKVSEAEVSN